MVGTFILNFVVAKMGGILIIHFFITFTKNI